MKKHFLLIPLLALSVSTLTAQEAGFTITGLTHNIPDGTVVYLVQDDHPDEKDSTLVADNRFQFTGQVEHYGRFWIQCFLPDRFEYCPLWVENVDMVLDARQTSFRAGEVSGSRLMDKWEELQHGLETWRDGYDRRRRKVAGGAAAEKGIVGIVVGSEMSSYQYIKSAMVTAK